MNIAAIRTAGQSMPGTDSPFTEPFATMSSSSLIAPPEFPQVTPPTADATFCNGIVRWYDPVTGRFLSNDPIGISGGLNQYVFCANNPVNRRDPFGLCDSLGMEGISEITTLLDIVPWGTIPGYGTAIGEIADAVAAGATELNILRMYFETAEISTPQTLWATGANALNLGVGTVGNVIGASPGLGTIGNVVGSALEFIIASWTAGITSPQQGGLAWPFPELLPPGGKNP